MQKKNIIIIITLFCVTSIAFTGCIRKRDHIYHFTPHDSLYFNAYDTTFYYQFETTQSVDSLWINKKVCIDNYKKWYIDICPPEGTFDPIFYYNGVFIHNGCKESFSLQLNKTDENTDPELTIVLGERYAFSINDSRNMKSEGYYNDTIIIDDTNSHVNHDFEHCFEFEYLIWHKYNGIIGYKLSDGTVYPLESRGNHGDR